MAPAREHIKLSVSKNSECLRFTVRSPSDLTGRWFEVPAASMRPASLDLRYSVEKLCKKYCADAGLDISRPERLRSAAAEVARYGAALRAQVFGDNEFACELEERLQTREAKLTFFVNHNVEVHAPYQLMFGYSGPEKYYDDLLTTELKAGFWRDLHDIEVIYPKDAASSDLEDQLTLDGDRMRVFGAFNRDLIQHVAENDLPIRWTPEDVVDTRAALERGFIEREGSCSVVYFFCHGDGEKLLLGGEEDYEQTVYAHHVETMIKNKKPRHLGLLFLNGCKTAVLQEKGNWLRAASAAGFLGFIGTEATIPTLYAWSFGNDLLKLILTHGLNPSEALKRLGDMHWPMSLLYGLYCISDVRVTPSLQTPYLTEVGDDNYCERQYSGSSMAVTLPFRKPLDDFGVPPQ